MFQIGCLFFAFTSLVFGDWVFEENKALTLSSERNVPILAVFLAKEGCCWSDQLKTELLQKSEFIKGISQQMVLWQVLKKETRDKYQAQEYPLILLLDPKGKEFARLNFIPLDCKFLKEQLSSLVDDFSMICSLVETDFEEEKWQRMYQKASRLSTPYFKEKILQKGIKKEKGCFFHLEKYARLLQEKGSNHPYVLELKKEIQRKDRMCQLGANAHLASIEFHDRERKGKSFDKTIEPLLEYLNKAAFAECQYRWKIELLLGQFLYKENHLEKAREYLLLAYEHAPDSYKRKLQEARQLGSLSNQ